MACMQAAIPNFFILQLSEEMRLKKEYDKAFDMKEKEFTFEMLKCSKLTN